MKSTQLFIATTALTIALTANIPAASATALQPMIVPLQSLDSSIGLPTLKRDQAIRKDVNDSRFVPRILTQPAVMPDEAPRYSQPPHMIAPPMLFDHEMDKENQIENQDGTVGSLIK